MNKELPIAIIVGLSFGLVIAQGIRISQTALKRAETKTNHQPNSLAAKLVTNPANHQLIMTSPVKNSLVDPGMVKVTGVTTQASHLFLTQANQILATIADVDGSFHFDLNLTKGPHLLEFTSIDPVSNAIATLSSLLVVNPIASTSGQAPVSPSPTPKTASPSPEIVNLSDTIKKRLESNNQKVDDRHVFVATISKITSNSLSLVTLEGDPKLASVSAQSQLVSLDAKKTYTLADLAVDSPVIIISKSTGSEAVIAIDHLILLTELPKASPYTIKFGKVLSLDAKNSRLILSQTESELAILTHKKTDLQINTNLAPFNYKSLSINQFISVIYDPAETDDAGPRANLILTTSAPPPQP